MVVAEAAVVDALEAAAAPASDASAVCVLVGCANVHTMTEPSAEQVARRWCCLTVSNLASHTCVYWRESVLV